MGDRKGQPPFLQLPMRLGETYTPCLLLLATSKNEGNPKGQKGKPVS